MGAPGVACEPGGEGDGEGQAELLEEGCEAEAQAGSDPPWCSGCAEGRKTNPRGGRAVKGVTPGVLRAQDAERDKKKQKQKKATALDQGPRSQNLAELNRLRMVEQGMAPMTLHLIPERKVLLRLESSPGRRIEGTFARRASPGLAAASLATTDRVCLGGLPSPSLCRLRRRS